MSVEIVAGYGTVITGPHIKLYGLLQLKHMLALEIKSGLRFRANPRAAACQYLGLPPKTKRPAALAAVEEAIAREFPLPAPATSNGSAHA